MRYGLSYKGSKNKIAKEVVEQLPEAAHFYDLFAGGCAVTHAAMLSGKWDTYTINDVDNVVNLFTDAVAGKYRNEKQWISRQDFERLKDTDPYVKYCWSFGNNGRDYLYSNTLEPYKKALHRMLHAKTVKEGRVLYRTVIRELAKIWVDSKSLESLESLQSLKSLQSLQSLESLQSLKKFKGDYQAVPIRENSVIYCDIPYKNTNGYGMEFDYDRFYDWACSQTEPVYISEYNMPADRFECVWEKEKISSLGSTNNTKTVERLFRPIKK